MELHTLKPPAGSRKNPKRLGRGTGSGTGKTSGRGHKGAGQRSGYSRKFGHEGGQMPLFRRLPKRGFANVFRREYQVVNVSDLERLEAGEITVQTLKDAGLIKKIKQPVKLLGNGETDKAFTIRVNAFSKSALQKIEAAGGKAEVI